jgi:hypothetical protein
MKVFVIAVAALALLAGPAMAGQCPLLIKQLKDAVGKMKPDDAMVKKATPLIADAQKLHDGGTHADAVKKAEEAAKTLGVKLEMKKM